MPRKKCANDVPTGDSNTESPLIAQGETNDRIDKEIKNVENESIKHARKYWAITMPMNRASHNGILEWAKNNCSYIIFQGEKGGETDYEHWQISMHLKTKKRLGWLKNHFCNISHIEGIRNYDAAFNYCKKSETRICGPYIWPEPVAKKERDFFTEYHCIMKKWQANIKDIINGPEDFRMINWFWSNSGNMGKSWFLRHICLTHNGLLVGGHKKDVFYAIQERAKTTQPDIICVNIARDDNCEKRPYMWLEDVKDATFFSAKYKSGMCMLNPMHIFVFANFSPDMTGMSPDRWNIVNVDEDFNLNDLDA